MAIITSVRDRVGRTFLNVAIERNSKTACRGIINALDSVRNDRNNPIVCNPEDFDLVKICDFDVESGLVSNPNVITLMSGIEVFNYLDGEYDDVYPIHDESEE